MPPRTDRDVAHASPTRRAFLASAAALAGPGGCWAMAASGKDDEWAFPLLGDLHIDRPTHHDADWVKTTHPNDVSQIDNYCKVTSDHTPKLLAAVNRAIEASKTPVPFVVQAGDLVEGLCGSDRLAALQARDAIDIVEAANLGAPVLMTKGNHDVTGPGASAAYDSVLVPWMARRAGENIGGAAFSRSRGGTLLAFYDAYSRETLTWFADLIRERKPRRLIVVVHPPVVPYNARAHWHVYAKPADSARRDKLLDLLGRNRAIVLGGHLHKFSALTRTAGSGAFTQLAISSVAVPNLKQPKDVLSGLESYGPKLTDLEPKHSPDTLEARKKTLADERPTVKSFEYADSWGYAWVRVTPERVTADVFHGSTDGKPWKTIDLTPPA